MNSRDALKQSVRAAGLKAGDVARLTGLSRTFVAAMMQGKHRIEPWVIAVVRLAALAPREACQVSRVQQNPREIGAQKSAKSADTSNINDIANTGRRLRNARVGGSIPSCGTRVNLMISLTMRYLAGPRIALAASVNATATDATLRPKPARNPHSASARNFGMFAWLK